MADVWCFENRYFFNTAFHFDERQSTATLYFLMRHAAAHAFELV